MTTTITANAPNSGNTNGPTPTPVPQPSSAAPTAPDTSVQAPSQKSDTVTLSDTAQQALANPDGGASSNQHVVIPPAVLANMQAFATSAPTQYSDQIKTDAATLVDTSSASDSNKIQAWVRLTKLLTSGSIYKAGNVADLQTALDATQGTAFFQKIQTLSSQMHSMEMQANPATVTNGAQNQLNALNQFSSSDQQILLAVMSGGGVGGNYSSVEAWKAALQQQGATLSGPQAANPSSTSAATTTSANPDKSIGSDNVAKTSGSTDAPAAPATEVIDAKTTLDQGVAKILASSQTESTKTAESDQGRQQETSRPDAQQNSSQVASLTEVITEMNASAPAQGFAAPPSQDNMTGGQIDQKA